MLLPIAYYGESVLRKKAVRVNQIDDDVRRLVADMIETMHALDGIGLAAPQVFHSTAIFITFVPTQLPDGKWTEGTNRVYINPKILKYSGETQILEEGCLSLPKIYVEIERPASIRIQATDLEGNLFEDTLSDLRAANFMHENDHLNGVLHIDRIHRKQRQALEPKLRLIKQLYSKE